MCLFFSFFRCAVVDPTEWTIFYSIDCRNICDDCIGAFVILFKFLIVYDENQIELKKARDIGQKLNRSSVVAVIEIHSIVIGFWLKSYRFSKLWTMNN